MNKNFQTTDTNTELSTSTALIVEIGLFKFVADERFPWIDIYTTGGEIDEFIERADDMDKPIINHDDLKIFAINWFSNNVEVVKEITNDEAINELLKKDPNFNIVQPLQSALDSINAASGKLNNSYLIKEEKLWCVCKGEDDCLICNIEDIEGFSVSDNARIQLQGEKLNDYGRLLTPWGPEPAI